jgi:hypothetical protein
MELQNVQPGINFMDAGAYFPDYIMKILEKHRHLGHLPEDSDLICLG